MQQLWRVELLLALCLWGTSASFAQARTGTSPSVQDAISQDPAPDPAHPARSEEIVVPAVDGSRLPGLLYVASGAGPHPTVLLLHGYPGDDAGRDLARSIRRLGWNVMIFHYRGLWGSPGSFSLSHGIEDTDAAFAFLRNNLNDEKYGIDRQRLVLLGHSMGGFMALRAASKHREDLLGVGVTSAVNFGAIGRSLESPESLQATKEAFTTVAPVAGTNPAALVAEVKANAKLWDYLDYAPSLHTLPVLVVEAKDPFLAQGKAMVAALRAAGDDHVTEKEFDTDHDFSERRIALQRVILTWLNGL